MAKHWNVCRVRNPSRLLTKNNTITVNLALLFQDHPDITREHGKLKQFSKERVQQYSFFFFFSILKCQVFQLEILKSWCIKSSLLSSFHISSKQKIFLFWILTWLAGKAPVYPCSMLVKLFGKIFIPSRVFDVFQKCYF